MNYNFSGDSSSLNDRINLIACLDHSGRAGNAFFLSIFDQHPEIICCPWMHYIYSYIVTEFDDKKELESEKAHYLMTKKTYYRFVYNDLDDNLTSQLVKFGADPSSVIDRSKVRSYFDNIVLGQKTIRRKMLIISAYISFFIGVGRDINRVKYILVSDAPSLRTENVLASFGGKTIQAMKNDFPQAKLISLVRDPRAVFSSSRHQFVNQFGNMYDIKYGNYFRRLNQLRKQQYCMESGCVYSFWLCYMASTAKTIYHYKKMYKDNFKTIRNEDLNLNFMKTMQHIAKFLDISFPDIWNNDYSPTMVGKPWRGTGAYNNRYQSNIYGPLKNDPQEIADKVTGPNAYVTQRWKFKLSKNEIKLIEILFREEMEDLSHEFIYYKSRPRNEIICVFGNILLPFKGEMPTLQWLRDGFRINLDEVVQRFFYALTFPPFFFLSRIQLFKLYLSKFFINTDIYDTPTN